VSLSIHSQTLSVQSPIHKQVYRRFGILVWNRGLRPLPLPAIAGILLLIISTGPQIAAQTTGQGLRITGASISETYFAQAVPDGIVAYGDVFLGSAITVSGAASIKWTRTRAKSFWNVGILPSYGNRFGDTGGRSWNGSALFSYSRRIGSKWTFTLSGAGQVMNFDESLFAPATLTQVASSGANFDDLSSAILRGTSSDPLLTSAAYGSLQPNQGLQSFLFGSRNANAGGQASLTYAHSARLSVSVVAGGLFVRHLNSQSDPTGFTYPQVTSSSTGVSLTYSLSPRTQIGVAGNYVRSQSTLINSSSRSFSASINRTMSRRWFVQASAGAGSSITGTSRSDTGIYSVGLGFKTYRHTALVSFNRTLDDPYATALASLQHSRGLNVTWHYGRPENPWWVDSVFTQLIAIYKGVPGTDTWSITETAGRRISRNYAVLVEYTMGRVGAKRYIQDGRQYKLEQTGIRTTFSWSPQVSHM
jgi:hypothetical protein